MTKRMTDHAAIVAQCQATQLRVRLLRNELAPTMAIESIPDGRYKVRRWTLGWRHLSVTRWYQSRSYVR